MTKLSVANCASISATVSLLDFAQEIGVDWDKVHVFVQRIERLRYVEYVEDRHQFWARLELETARGPVAEKRIAATLEKIERILRRYAK